MGILGSKVADNELARGGEFFVVWCYCVGGWCCTVVVTQVIIIIFVIISFLRIVPLQTIVGVISISPVCDLFYWASSLVLAYMGFAVAYYFIIVSLFWVVQLHFIIAQLHRSNP